MYIKYVIFIVLVFIHENRVFVAPCYMLSFVACLALLFFSN